MLTSWRWRGVGRAMGWLLLGVWAAAADAADEDLLRDLPSVELAFKDTLDHWGLPFADQLRRFKQAQASWQDLLGADAPAEFMVGTQHGLEKTPRNKYWFKGSYGNRVQVSAARNEVESFQVAVLPAIGAHLRHVTLAAGPLRHERGSGTIPATAFTIYRVGYVETVPAQYPTLYTGAWPDVLLPNGPLEIDGVDLGLFWIDVKVPPDAASGSYRGTLALEADGRRVAIDVDLHVYSFALPDRVPFPIAVWTSAIWPPGQRMSPETYRQTLAMFLEHGVDPISVGKQDVSLDKLDLAAFDANLEFCLARGLQMFEIPSAPKTPEKLRSLVEHLRQKGWLAKALVYSSHDEPTDQTLRESNIPYYQRMKKLYPDLRIYLASQYYPEIDQACDIWMSDVSTAFGAAFAAAHRGRSELWFYYCHLPIHIDFCRPLVQAPNMQIDNEAIEHRLAPWVAWKHDTPGMFIWAGNRSWERQEGEADAWEKTGWRLTNKNATFPFGGIHNGNGFLLYPGPHPSIRLKVLRDGVEDFGYLMELKKRRSQAQTSAQTLREIDAALAVPTRVLVDTHYFNRDPRGLLESRATIARLIEQLDGDHPHAAQMDE